MTTVTTSTDRAALLDTDRCFFDALVSSDVARLTEVLADDFILVGVDDGALVGRTDLLNAVSTGAIHFPAIESFPGEAAVRRIGDVGIVVGRTAMNFATEDGAKFMAGSRYTHIFDYDASAGWRLVSAQGTRIM